MRAVRKGPFEEVTLVWPESPRLRGQHRRRSQEWRELLGRSGKGPWDLNSGRDKSLERLGGYMAGAGGGCATDVVACAVDFSFLPSALPSSVVCLFSRVS